MTSNSFTFSPLCKRTVPHFNKFTTPGQPKKYLIVHHWAGVVGGDARLLNPNEAVSANYILYSTGELVGQVPEDYRAWTSGSYDADAPGVTVETQNTGGRHPGAGDMDPRSWPVSNAALETLAQLAADLCRRYNWGKLDRTRVRGHREFDATACPGGYLWSKLDWIIQRGNEILNQKPTPKPEPIEEEDEMAKNSGVYWSVPGLDNTWHYAVFNTDSGFWHTFGNGEGRGKMPADYNNALARAMDTPSWAQITFNHSKVLKAACDAVREGK